MAKIKFIKQKETNGKKSITFGVPKVVIEEVEISPEDIKSKIDQADLKVRNLEIEINTLKDTISQYQEMLKIYGKD